MLPRLCLRLRPRTLRLYSTPPLPKDASPKERTIHHKLTQRFSPTTLQIQDVSGGCGDFYAIVIASDAFKGLSTVNQHKLVNSTLENEIKSIHGIQLKTLLPGQE